MARKRVSLKDKGPETLGLTEKKGQGIDVLFGGSTAARTRSASGAGESKITNQPNTEEENMATENKESLTNSAGNVTVAPPPAPAESLPVNEADDDLSSVAGDGTDELGLPVAMEAPPASLMAAGINSGQVDELGLPVAMDAPPADLTLPVPPSAPPPVTTTASDLAGLADDNDLSGLAGEETAPPFPSTEVPQVEPMPATPTPPPPVAIPEPPSMESVPVAPPVESIPPFTPAADVPPERPLPTPPPITPVIPSYPPPTYEPAPTPVTVPTPVTPPPPPPRIDSFTGLVTAAGAVRPEDILPEDLRYGSGGFALDVAERAKIERDERVTEQVARYIGQERRQELDKEIARLYDAVAAELSDNKEDASIALKTLSEAQDIVLEDIRQFDEALYRVAVVKTMLVRKQNLRRWSYTWGLFVFFYSLVWLTIFIAGYVLTDAVRVNVDTFGPSAALDAVRAAWHSALAGGIGGIIGILYSLYWHVAYKQDFDRQYVMYYLVQPVMGFVLGAVIYFIISAGFLIASGTEMLSSETVITLQILLGWIAGFRQRIVFELIDKIVQKISPQESDSTPVSVVPEQ